MGLFSKTEAEPVVSGTDVLRTVLQGRTFYTKNLPLSAVVRDVNDAASNEANRATAKDIAARMTNDAAAAEQLARNLVNTLSPGKALVSEMELQSFLDGGDLSPEIKKYLARYLYDDRASYDSERDLLASTTSITESKPVQRPPTIPPDPDFIERTKNRSYVPTSTSPIKQSHWPARAGWAR